MTDLPTPIPEELPHQRTVGKFIKRLNAAITRSPLLRVPSKKASSHVDVTRFDCVQAASPARLVAAMIRGQATELEFDAQEFGTLSTFDDDEPKVLFGDRKLRAQRALYSQLESMRRNADLALRETGIHALWLAYPLIYVPPSVDSDSDGLLAPLLLFPAEIVPNPRRQGRVAIRRKSELAPRFNTAMAAWVLRRHGVEIDSPSADDLAELTQEWVESLMGEVASRFRPAPSWPSSPNLVDVPTSASLEATNRVQFFRAGVLGRFRWQNESILADLETIRKSERCSPTADGLLRGTLAPDTPLVPPPESDRYFVTDADFSQQRVVWKARQGTGLVVHGPPGTGKSQTIVNIIADALAHKQTVLMVCQKEAATRVVWERLKKAHLDKLCIHMHDPESDRRHVCGEIRDQVVDLGNFSVLTEDVRRAAIAREIEVTERDLDEAAAALREQHPRLGCSYRDLLAMEGKLLRSNPTVRPLPGIAAIGEKLDANSLPSFQSEVARAGTAFFESQYFENPWRERTRDFVFSSTFTRDVKELLGVCEELNGEHENLLAKSPLKIFLPDPPATIREEFSAALATLENTERMEPDLRGRVIGWLDHLRETGAYGEAEVLARVGKEEERARHARGMTLDPLWSEAIGKASMLNAQVLRRACIEILRFEKKWWRAASSKFRECRRIVLEARPDAIGDSLFDVSRAAKRYFAEKDAIDSTMVASKGVQPGVAFDATDLESAYVHVARAEESLRRAIDISGLHRAFPWARPLIDSAVGGASPARASVRSVIEVLERRVGCVERLLLQLEELRRWFPSKFVDALRHRALAGQTIKAEVQGLALGIARVEGLQHFEGLQETASESARIAISALLDYETRARSDEVRPVHPHPDSGAAFGQWWRALASASVIDSWRREIVLARSVLTRLGHGDQEALVAQLRRALEAKRRSESAVIHTRWRAEQEAYRNQPWSVFFKLRGGKHGPAPKLREAVRASVDKGLLAMRPVWLTNPAAAAQVFPLSEGLFDVVIFDEASQCPIEQALPVVWRGKRLVVAGDEKQLPPTGFFVPEADDPDSTEEEEQEATDKPVQSSTAKLVTRHVSESQDLLAAAVAGMPSAYLRVHYRSDHPALIEFSNRAFYDGQLEAPPSRLPSTAALSPIQFTPIAGTYERKRRVNQAEAAAVVRLIRDTLENDSSNPTIGVVTFNQPQRELIQDLLETERLKSTHFASRYDEEVNRTIDDQDVGLFVKNLENVQGDERDVMIFSTTFGPDGAGHFHRKFGPVGQETGERRLNVAITRAKKRVHVVSSMPIGEVATALGGQDTTGAGITPAGYLQLYLAYAQALSAGQQDRVRQILDKLKRSQQHASQGSPESGLEEEVCGALQELGYQVDSQIGVGGFRIDLAVRHPDPNRGYVLGIECDGAAYHSSRSARLRDVWRQSILEGRYGWRMHRVWSTRWWQDQDAEIIKLRRAVEIARARST